MDYFEASLEGFGFLEIKKTAKLLNDFVKEKTTLNFNKHFATPIQKIGFNANSGNVFLIDDNGNVFMGSPLNIFLSLPYSGEEGYPSDFESRDIAEFNSDDVEYLKEFGFFDDMGIFKEEKFKRRRSK